MTKPWISDSRQRRSKKYKKLHERLRADLTLSEAFALESLGQGDKAARKRAKSLYFRQVGE